MRLTKYILAILLLCGFAVAQLTPGSTTHPPNTTVVFYDNFNHSDTPNLGTGWAAQPLSTWKVISDAAVIPGSPYGCSTFADLEFPGSWCNAFATATLTNNQYASVRMQNWAYGAFGVRYRNYGTSPDGTGNPLISGIYLNCNSTITGGACGSFNLSVGPDVAGGVDNQVGSTPIPPTPAGPTNTISLMCVGYPPTCTLWEDGVQFSSYTFTAGDMFPTQVPISNPVSGSNPGHFDFASQYASMGLTYQSGVAGIQAFREEPLTGGYGFTYFEAGNVTVPIYPPLVWTVE